MPPHSAPYREWSTGWYNAFRPYAPLFQERSRYKQHYWRKILPFFHQQKCAIPCCMEPPAAKSYLRIRWSCPWYRFPPAWCQDWLRSHPVSSFFHCSLHTSESPALLFCFARKAYVFFLLLIWKRGLSAPDKFLTFLLSETSVSFCLVFSLLTFHLSRMPDPLL